MKISILIPGLFAAIGALSLALNNSPRNEVNSRVGRAREREIAIFELNKRFELGK